MSETILEHGGMTITRPCKHGLNLDWTTETGKRIHLRLYVFEPGQIEGEWVEMPAELTPEAALVYQRMSLEKLREAVLAGVFTPPETAVKDLVQATYPQPAEALSLLDMEALDLRLRYGYGVRMVRPRPVGFVEIELPDGERRLLASQVWQDYQWAAVHQDLTREVLP
jgi:hypothetical protein